MQKDNESHLFNKPFDPIQSAKLTDEMRYLPQEIQYKLEGLGEKLKIKRKINDLTTGNLHRQIYEWNEGGISFGTEEHHELTPTLITAAEKGCLKPDILWGYVGTLHRFLKERYPEDNK